MSDEIPWWAGTIMAVAMGAVLAALLVDEGAVTAETVQIAGGTVLVLLGSGTLISRWERYRE